MLRESAIELFVLEAGWQAAQAFVHHPNLMNDKSFDCLPPDKDAAIIT